MSVQFVVGNTYVPIPERDQRYDKTGTVLKPHDWTLFLDVVNGDPDLIHKVTFDLPTFTPRKFACTCPIRVTHANGSKAWRFATRQQSYGATQASIIIRGAGGSTLLVEHTIQLKKNRAKLQVQTFHENRPSKPCPKNQLPEKRNFGLELELTANYGCSTDDVASALSRVCDVHVAEGYGSGRATCNDWKLVPDSSIVCNTSQPDCTTFELVSPILRGGGGLEEINHISKELGRLALRVNKSMGFHVHIDVSDLSVSQLVKVCQNFVKYEDVMDSFLPPSRRTGSAQSNRFFKSNRDNLGQETNEQRHHLLAACSDVHSLAQMMNSGDRYFKLNLQNLASGRQPTIEFRQHSATSDYHKISCWIRFCMAFVCNSARLAPPSAFRKMNSVDDQFEALFMYVIKDRALKAFYQERQIDVEGRDECCDSCAAGRACSSNGRPVQVYSTGLGSVIPM